MMKPPHITIAASISALGAGLLACGSAEDEKLPDDNGFLQQAGAGGASTVPPLTSGGSAGASDQGDTCASRPTCYERCVCGGSDHDSCVDQCMAPPAMPGAGGASPMGAGGTSVVGTGGALVGAGGAVVTGAGGAPVGAGGAPPTSQYESVRFQTTPFQIAPGQEMYRCQNFKNPFPGGDVAVVQSQSFMSVGSHHMFVMYNSSNRDGGTEVCSGLEFSQTIISTGNHETNVVYPPGVGRLVTANEGFRVLVHALNTTPEAIDFKVDVIFHYTTPDAVDQLAGSVFLNKLAFAIPAGAQNYEVSGGGTIPEDVYLLTGQSHMHKYGIRFEAKTSTGEPVYETTEWSEPPTRNYDPPMLLRAGSRIDYSCWYNNTSSRTLTFGDSANTNEMCIFSGTYFAPRDGSLRGRTLGGAVTF